jgi:hypothetical protein
MKATSPLVSFVTPSYNMGKYLPELCGSIEAQTYKNFEVLILNDGSTDDTEAVLAPFRKDPRFRIWSWKDNRGYNAATTALLLNMQGQYWCHPGGDDVLKDNFLEQRVELLECHPEAAMVHGAADYIDEHGQIYQPGFARWNLPAQMGAERALSVLLQHNIINAPSIMARSSVTQLIRPFLLTNWIFALDWFTWMLVLSSGFDLLWDARPLHKYRVHTQSLTNISSKEAVRRAEVRLVPLCAMSAAASFSLLAADLWQRWRSVLYALWLRRALNLKRRGMLRPEWCRQAARAYYGKNSGKASLLTELCLHLDQICMTTWKENRAKRQQRFEVCGIAHMNDPVFASA